VVFKVTSVTWEGLEEKPVRFDYISKDMSQFQIVIGVGR